MYVKLLLYLCSVIAKRGWEIGLLCVVTAVVCSCTAHKVREAQAVAAQADSLWHAGKMYGVDEGDSATLAMAYETMKKHSAFSRQFSEVCPFVHGTSSPCTYSHLCYQYGRLLRAKDDPVSAMRVFIDATHSHTRDFHILGRVYSNMGSICHLAGEFPLSYDMYERSADCFLKNGDTIAYYFLLNDMAFELAEQGKEEETLALLSTIDKNNPDLNLRANMLGTKAKLFFEKRQYDSVIETVNLMLLLGIIEPTSCGLKARAFWHIENTDSALFYAKYVLNIPSVSEQNKYNMLYILANGDSSLSHEDLLAISAQRSDIETDILIPQHNQWALAVQLLEQDLARKPDLRWLVAIVVTILVISLCLLLYIFRKRRQHKLLSQQVNELATANAAVKQQHEQMVQEYTNYKQNKVEQIEHNCTILLQAEDFPKNIHWKDYNIMCRTIDQLFFFLTSKLKQKQILNEQEIRLCILVLLNLNRNQIASILPYAQTGIGKFKYRIAQKLQTDGKNLRKYLICMAVDDWNKDPQIKMPT